MNARRIIILIVLLLALVIGGLIVRSALDQEKALRSRQTDLVDAIERGKWKTFRKVIDPEYADSWGYDAETAEQILHTLRQHFIVLDLAIEAPDTATVNANGMGSTSFGITMSGKGTGVAQQIIQAANTPKEPFTLLWRRDGWTTGWRVISVSHPTIQIPGPDVLENATGPGGFLP